MCTVRVASHGASHGASHQHPSSTFGCHHNDSDQNYVYEHFTPPLPPLLVSDTHIMPHAEGSSPAAVKDEPVDDAGITSSIPQGNDDDVDMLDASGAAADASAVKKADVKLDDLFANDDSDEEFPSSAPVKAAPSSPQGPASPT